MALDARILSGTLPRRRFLPRVRFVRCSGLFRRFALLQTARARASVLLCVCCATLVLFVRTRGFGVELVLELVLLVWLGVLLGYVVVLLRHLRELLEYVAWILAGFEVVELGERSEPELRVLRLPGPE